MDVVDLSFDLRDDVPITAPIADTPAGWITFGMHEDLNQAVTLATHGMLDLLVRRFKVSKMDALALAGVAVDLRITQVVNDVRGVHAVLPHGVMR